MERMLHLTLAVVDMEHSLHRPSLPQPRLQVHGAQLAIAGHVVPRVHNIRVGGYHVEVGNGKKPRLEGHVNAVHGAPDGVAYDQHVLVGSFALGRVMRLGLGLRSGCAVAIK